MKDEFVYTGLDNPEPISAWFVWKSQNTNHKLQTMHLSKKKAGAKFQITNYKKRGVLRTHFRRLRREVYKSVFKPDRAVCDFGHCILEFVCNLYFGICNFISCHVPAIFHGLIIRVPG